MTTPIVPIRIPIGTARTEHYGDFEIARMPGGQPIIRSKKSGKYWGIGWYDLIRMAVNDGILIEDE